MKQINKCHALSMAILALLATGCHFTDHDRPLVYSLGITFWPSVATIVANKKFSEDDAAHDRLVSFTQTNWVNLKADMAKGGGEYLASLYRLLGRFDSKELYFSAMCKKRFAQLVPDSHTTPEQFLHNLGYSKRNLIRQKRDYINFDQMLTDATNAAITLAQKNWSNLKADMEKGQGQYLIEVADILYVPYAKRAAFYAMNKDNFTALFPTSDTTAEQLVKNLEIERNIVTNEYDTVDNLIIHYDRYIAEEMILKGQGLHLSIMANALKIPTSKRAAFYAMIKTKFHSPNNEHYLKDGYYNVVVKQLIAEAAKL